MYQVSERQLRVWNRSIHHRIIDIISNLYTCCREKLKQLSHFSYSVWNIRSLFLDTHRFMCLINWCNKYKRKVTGFKSIWKCTNLLPYSTSSTNRKYKVLDLSLSNDHQIVSICNEIRLSLFENFDNLFTGKEGLSVKGKG